MSKTFAPVKDERPVRAGHQHVLLTELGDTYILVGMKGIKEPQRSRETIVRSALKNMHRRGYGAASLTDILAGTGLTRGALYYHFPGKEALGHAVLDVIDADLRSTWISPIDSRDDPITALQKVLQSACSQMTPEEVSLGCPLNNLNQEMSSVDESFRIKIDAIYRLWIDRIAEVLRRGQQLKQISRSVDPHSAAAFIVAAWTGARGVAKATRDSRVLADCVDQLMRYLESLTEVYDMIRVINGHAEAERWFAVMAIARESHDLLSRHLDKLNPIAQRAVETFHIGHRREEPVLTSARPGTGSSQRTDGAPNPFRGLQ